MAMTHAKLAIDGGPLLTEADADQIAEGINKVLAALL
jgi:hypothetical protein